MKNEAANHLHFSQHLRKLNNFNSYLAILSALDSAPIRRLEWQKQTSERSAHSGPNRCAPWDPDFPREGELFETWQQFNIMDSMRRFSNFYMDTFREAESSGLDVQKVFKCALVTVPKKDDDYEEWRRSTACVEGILGG
ncbi:Rap guanine nucleotide exchange factor 1 [Bagarius yarrelli]|uniref:Rap guanine nucleotide exchange factor 1 n=1 Tax=Bagarius yarrelli TaxID=175774 RepID=A0A556UFK0_BAGYA|nr:Rap guanine nucleotide exchange factor 1 [Bagarius yarrelli]